MRNRQILQPVHLALPNNGGVLRCHQTAFESEMDLLRQSTLEGPTVCHEPIYLGPPMQKGPNFMFAAAMVLLAMLLLLGWLNTPARSADYDFFRPPAVANSKPGTPYDFFTAPAASEAPAYSFFDNPLEHPPMPKRPGWRCYIVTTKPDDRPQCLPCRRCEKEKAVIDGVEWVGEESAPPEAKPYLLQARKDLGTPSFVFQDANKNWLRFGGWPLQGGAQRFIDIVKSGGGPALKLKS